MRIPALDLKLLRDLWRIKGQALAIILVQASGISLLVMSLGMIASLTQTMDAYYDRYRFADVFASATRAPHLVLEQIASVDGVSAVDGRVMGGGLIDLPHMDAPVTAQFVSLQPDPENQLNRVHLVRGRMPDPLDRDEILLLKNFAEAHELSPGDPLIVTVYGTQRRFRIAGIALSPEYIYAIAPGAPTPDDRRFAVIWAPDETLKAAFDLDGAFNQVAIKLARGAEVERVLDDVDQLLEPYGGRGAIAREDQISNKFLTEELRQLNTMTFVMTPIFMSVTIFLLNVVISRMVQTEREQIGLLKAFGYTDGEIGGHYAKFALVLALGGAAIGWLGGLYLGRVITEIYRQYYQFPFLIFVTDLRTAVYAIGLSIGGAGLGAFGAVRGAVSLQPAVAMRPPAPERFGSGLQIERLVELLDRPTRMILRRIIRRPVRSATLVLGISAAMGLSVMMEYNNAAIRHILNASFQVVDRSDVTVLFTEPRGRDATLELLQVDGVERVEGFRSVSVTFSHGLKEHLGAITGLTDGPQLNRIVDEDMRAVAVPDNGILLSRQLADILELKVGDTITAKVKEGRLPELEIEVTGLIDALIGTPAYMAIEDLNARLLEPGRYSGAYLAVAPERLVPLQRAMKKVPGLASISIRKDILQNFSDLLDQGPGTFRIIMSFFAVLIAVGVVYNGARITFGERQHDIASLRILGFTRGEAAYVVIGEIMLLAVAALPIGALIGTLLWTYISVAMSTELYQIPIIANPRGFGFAGFTVLISAAVSAVLIRRDLDKLDMVSALKARD